MKRLLKSLLGLKGRGLLFAGMATVMVVSGCGSTAPAAPAAGQAAGGNTAANPTAEPKKAEKTEFAFYLTGSLNVKELWETLIPMFEKKNPDVKVKLVHIPSGQGGQSTVDRLLAAKKAGQKSVDIDLYESGINDMLVGEKDGIWAQVDTKSIPNISKVDERYMKDVKNLAIPYRASSVVLAYNSKNVPNPPKTSEELYDWIRKHPGKFAYNDPATGGAGSSFVVTALYNFLPPEDMYSQDKSVMEKWDKGFALLKELHPYMYQKGVYPKKNQGTLDILASGEVDMIPAWSDMGLEQLDKKLLPETVKLTQIDPPFTGGPTLLMVPAMSEKKAAVQKFLDFSLSQEAQVVIVNKMFGYPGIKWSEMPGDYQKKFESVAKAYRQFQGGDLGTEINKRWQRDVAGQ
ncbi:MAG: transporter substrate-binding protein [Paenibacillus sp.]|nr:transporter substrate-binding protein [Paenibacillus sp.]